MTLLKAIFAARCPQCNSRLRYTGWKLPYPQYICQYCVNVEQLNMEISIAHKKRVDVRSQEEGQLIFDNFVKRRREKQSSVLSKETTENPNPLYICKNFTTKSSICDRCRCNIWHKEGMTSSFKGYRDCYEPTIFEIKTIIAL